jgi:hypothetical protein
MGGAHGVKETKEGLLAVAALGAFIASRLKDGVDLGDAIALAQKLANDTEFVEKVKVGVEGFDKIADEVKELDLQDALEIVMCMPLIVQEIEKYK